MIVVLFESAVVRVVLLVLDREGVASFLAAVLALQRAEAEAFHPLTQPLPPLRQLYVAVSFESAVKGNRRMESAILSTTHGVFWTMEDVDVP